MSTSIKWNTSASKEVAAVARPRWKQVRQGLGLAVMGQFWFLALALAGLLLALLSALLFSGYARAVARYFKDPDGARRVAAYFWFVLFLLAGTAGLLPQARRSSRLDVWVVLAAAWLICLAWHALVIR